jgi:3-hydroxy acid dehydrogenase/malonic semialdehyde reductase
MNGRHTVVITGASSGIGQASCLRLLREGYTVVGIARDFAKFPFQDRRFHPISINLADLDNLPSSLQALQRAFPDVDGVICNAGRGHFGSLEEFSYQQIRSLVELNLISHVYIVRTFLPAMKRRGRGDVVFVGSEAALAGGRRGAVYSATKFALRGLAQALREECARQGIRVCIVNPGMVKTAFFDDLSFAPGEAPENYILPEDVAEALAMVLESRPGTVFDEITLSPLKKVVTFRKPSRGDP